VRKHLLKPELAAPFIALRDRYAALPSFDREALEQTLKAVAEAGGLKPGALIHAVRVAVTGRAVSPGLYEVLELLGRDRVVARLDQAAPRIAAPPGQSHQLPPER
jgi:glutamyl/glutaminyl-tRNA synthetase